MAIPVHGLRPVASCSWTELVPQGTHCQNPTGPCTTVLLPLLQPMLPSNTLPDCQSLPGSADAPASSRALTQLLAIDASGPSKQ